MQHARTRIVIVGGGFAGLAAARALQGAPVDVTLVDRNNYHVFQPLLYQVATGSVSPDNITTPLRDAVGRRSQVRVLMDAVRHVDVPRRIVELGDTRLPYDKLIVAAGTATSYFGQTAFGQHAHGLKTLDDALNIRRRVLFALEQAELCRDAATRRSHLTFVVVGGGPTGVEVAGALANLLHDMARVRFTRVDVQEATILLVESSARLLPPYPEQLSHGAAQSLRSLQVQLVLDARVTAVDAAGVHIVAKKTGVGRYVAARTVIWAAGMQAVPLAADLARQTGTDTNRQGRLMVDAQLRLSSHPDIFVVGDMAAITDGDGRTLPAVAQVASQAGTYAGRHIAAELRGETLGPFAYRDWGSMAVIGRGRAVVATPWLRLSGPLAWGMWLVVHLAKLRGTANKFFVGVQWLLSFVVKRPSARVLIGQHQLRQLPPNPELLEEGDTAVTPPPVHTAVSVDTSA